MRHALAVACAFVLCATLGSGCGGSHRNTLASASYGLRPIGATATSPPRWLAKFVGQEARAYGITSFHTVEYHFGKNTDVAQIFGRIKTPPPTACKSGYYCPSPIRLHGRNVRLVVSTRTHRILSARIGERIAHTQAPEIARHASRYFHIFLPTVGTAACKIPEGGTHLRPVYLHGHCATSYVSRPPSPDRGQIRIKFIEVWSPSGGASGPPMRAGWIVTVGPTGHVRAAFGMIGDPPQLWK